MKNWQIGGLIVAVLVVIFVLWKWVIKTGNTDVGGGIFVFKRGGKYFQTDGKTNVEINKTEYNSLVEASKTTDCVKPPGTFRQTEYCTYYSPNDPSKLTPYKGYLDDCGRCRILNPIEREA